MSSVKSRIKEELQNNTLYYLAVYTLFFIAASIRVFRIPQLLNFQYDQGRDALAIAEILTGNITLIGPTTGIGGIYRGPFYYYFLAPGYLLGGGDPAVASYYQTFFVLLGWGVVFYILRKYFSKPSALFVIFLAAFSYFQILYDRWLSNPTPAILLSSLTLLFLALSFKRPLPYLPLSYFGIGLLLQLETASSFFLMVSTILLVLIYRKIFSLKAALFSAFAFLATLIPQVAFDLRHNFLVTKSLVNFVLNRGVENIGGETGASGAAFAFPTWRMFFERFDFISVVFLEKLKIHYHPLFPYIFALFLAGIIFLSYKYWSRPVIKVAFFWFFGMIIFFSFYRGNYGRVYTYYFTSMLPIFFFYCALILDYIYKRGFLGKVIVCALLIAFVWDKKRLFEIYFLDGLDGPTTIALGNQTAAVKYVLENSGKEFNYDVYVPPVIPYTYTYLFDYLGSRYNKHQSNSRVAQLYTIHEADTERPARERVWLERQDGIGKITGSPVRFGGVTVEKRDRIKYSD